MSTKVVLFDMDGVLIDAREWHFLALNTALVKHGFSPINTEDHLGQYNGLPTKTKLEMLGIDKSLHASINQTKQIETIAIAKQHCRPIPEVTQTLLDLVKYHPEIKFGVCSNSIKHTIETFLTLAKIRKFFEVVVSNEDVNHPKPHPEIYQTGMKFFGVEPQEALVVEDNENGIAASRAAGVEPIIISNPQDLSYALLKQRIVL